MQTENRIVLLCSDGDSTRSIYNALRKKNGDIKVVMEKPISRWEMAKRRAKRLGFVEVFGQMLFVGVVVSVLARLSRKRIAEIEQTYNLENDWENAEIIEIDSVNSEKAIEILKEIKPKLVVVNGTRIIGKKLLESTDTVFINTHAGITPLYRGVHGAYWALAESKPDLVGTTVHLVDKGIDTGNIIEQAFFDVTEDDNFATYPYLHTAFGIPILLDAVERCLNDNLKLKDNPRDMPSKLRYHPTIWQYIYYRINNNIK